MIDKHTLKLLEFERIKQIISLNCFSDSGKRLLFKQDVLTEKEAVLKLLNLSVEFRNIMDSGKSLPALSFPYLEDILPKLTKEGIALDKEELSCIARYLASAFRIKQFLQKQSIGSSLSVIAGSIPDLFFLVREIGRIIDKNGNVKEKQIPVLRDIVRSIKSIQKSIEKTCNAYFSDPANKLYWQSDQPTLRDGRMVLPLKANFKGKIKGIVHEVSSSGATVFLEPLDIVDKNNTLREEEERYRRELFRIFKELSSKIANELDDIIRTVNTVSYLDTLYARAEYARQNRCHAAIYQSGTINLMEARHPLLGKECVPISISLDEDCRMLIITGPNTGGKTVTLKTVGLLCVMNQFGMEIPASEGSELDIFDDILADIGDEQSITQSLSTFSGHIKRLSCILRKSSGKSLVLLDELGAGTDPEEGVAIAMALLDYFIQKKCFTIITTHHGILKNYGYTKDGVKNASMEFNTETLKPTFHIIMGLPGKSHALEIAGRHGIPHPIIGKAEGYLKDERSDISNLVVKLSERERELFYIEQTQKEKEQEIRNKKRKTDLRELGLKQREWELREGGLKEIKRFLDESRMELDGLIRELKEGELTKSKTVKVHNFLEKIREKVQTEKTRIEFQKEEIEERHDFHTGMSVVIKSTNERGIILRPVKKNSWLVETKNLKITLKSHEMRPVKDEDLKNEKRFEISSTDITYTESKLDLNVRGFKLEEALLALEKQIDSAVLNGLNSFSIIHGKGEGILREAIHHYLSKCQVVEEFHLARPEEGGFGRTFVHLKT
jgi:DNA mismatch repair protein MutS2